VDCNDEDQDITCSKNSEGKEEREEEMEVEVQSEGEVGGEEKDKEMLEGNKTPPPQEIPTSDNESQPQSPTKEEKEKEDAPKIVPPPEQNTPTSGMPSSYVAEYICPNTGRTIRKLVTTGPSNHLNCASGNPFLRVPKGKESVTPTPMDTSEDRETKKRSNRQAESDDPWSKKNSQGESSFQESRRTCAGDNNPENKGSMAKESRKYDGGKKKQEGKAQQVEREEVEAEETSTGKKMKEVKALVEMILGDTERAVV